MLAYAGYRLADLLVSVLPPGAADDAARALARVAFWLRVPARRVLEANLARLRPGAGHLGIEALARQGFEGFALSMVDFLRLARVGSADLAAAVQVRGAEHLEAAIATRRGVIVLSAHVGSWERGAAFLALGVPRLHVVARPHPSRRVERFFERRRRKRGVEMLPGPPLWPGAASALRRGEWVALMGDRMARATRVPVWTWAAALSRRTGALVLPAVVVRLASGHYAACFEAPLPPESADDCRQALGATLRRHASQWSAFEPCPEGLA